LSTEIYTTVINLDLKLLLAWDTRIFRVSISGSVQESGEVRILRGFLKGVHLSRITGSQIHPVRNAHEIKGLLWK
jgi:hypothetical protein